MEDDKHEARGARKKRHGAQQRYEVTACKNNNVCDRVLTENAARSHKFCSNECELGWMRMHSNRETYNKAFYMLCARLPYMPMADMVPRERVAETHYSEESKVLYWAVVNGRTGKN